jgi:hypothetical protein
LTCSWHPCNPSSRTPMTASFEPFFSCVSHRENQCRKPLKRWAFWKCLGDCKISYLSQPHSKSLRNSPSPKLAHSYLMRAAPSNKNSRLTNTLTRTIGCPTQPYPMTPIWQITTPLSTPTKQIKTR